MTNRSRFWSYSGTNNTDEYRYFWPNDWARRNRQQSKHPQAEMFAGSPTAKAGVQCVDCHMAKIGTRSTATSKGGRQLGHLVARLQSSYSANGENPRHRSSCESCHEGKDVKLASGVQAPPLNTDVLMAIMSQRQGENRKAVTEVQRLLTGVKSKKPEAAALAERANNRLNVVLLNGSLGMHNQERTATLIEDARKLAVQASRIK